MAQLALAVQRQGKVVQMLPISEMQREIGVIKWRVKKKLSRNEHHHARQSKMDDVPILKLCIHHHLASSLDMRREDLPCSLTIIMRVGKHHLQVSVL
ncbi:hypothetical protein OIDMADRAFT_16026 [Oidiodendron maius Zn]|uniref:Uncharacterized protein n=1 Tax=Oidiodendron maius (strain Zn) TaxID=913774 RepID=A0A0C3DYP0_OIDMZ|nr:hypothetical protein OIDMADRAFT_16026 [Oidiodendron maius Zn]